MDNHWFEAAAHHMGDAYLNYSFTKGSEQEVAFLIKSFWPVFSEALGKPTDEEAMQDYTKEVMGDWMSIKARYSLSKSWQAKTNNELRTLLFTACAVEYLPPLL